MEATERTWADQVYEEGTAQGLREAIERLVRVRCGRVTPEMDAPLTAMVRDEDRAAFVERVGQANSAAALLAL